MAAAQSYWLQKFIVAGYNFTKLWYPTLGAARDIHIYMYMCLFHDYQNMYIYLSILHMNIQNLKTDYHSYIMTFYSVFYNMNIYIYLYSNYIFCIYSPSHTHNPSPKKTTKHVAPPQRNSRFARVKAAAPVRSLRGIVGFCSGPASKQPKMLQRVSRIGDPVSEIYFIILKHGLSTLLCPNSLTPKKRSLINRLVGDNYYTPFYNKKKWGYCMILRVSFIIVYFYRVDLNNQPVSD